MNSTTTKKPHEKLEQTDMYLSRRKRIEIGTISGLCGGFAIFLTIFAVDANLAVVPGTFYKMVGIPVGLEGLAATIFGLAGHMMTAALIGATFCYCSGLHKRLEIKTPKKGAIAGGVTGIAVYAIFFMPITFFIMTPSLEASTTDAQGLVATLANIDSKKLVENIDLVLFGALEMHIVYGIIMGTVCGMAAKSTITKNLPSLKLIALAIIIATGTVASYYVVIESYSTKITTQGALTAELERLQEGLTYTKFVQMDKEARDQLVSIMPGSTINLMVQEAKKHNSFASDGMGEITSNLSNGELKYIQLGQIKGVKGNDATGQAFVISAGTEQFLRFEKFSVTNGPVLNVALTKDGNISTGYNVGPLKANSGDQNYNISGIDTSQYSVVVIYSEPFGHYYASSNLVRIQS